MFLLADGTSACFLLLLLLCCDLIRLTCLPERQRSSCGSQERWAVSISRYQRRHPAAAMTTADGRENFISVVVFIIGSEADDENQ